MRVCCFVICFLVTMKVFSQENFHLQVKLLDKTNRDPIPGAVLYIKQIGQGAVSDRDGLLKMDLKAGFYTFEIRHIAYQILKDSVFLKRDKQFQFFLYPVARDIDEVVVNSQKPVDRLRDAQSGVMRMQSQEINQLPQLMGESDILGALRLSPGVKSGGEGNPAVYVRGGGPGENLVILDYLPLYNPSHLLGLYSVFNNDVIREVNLYKGAFPANYGGRASSVIQVYSKEGAPEKPEVIGSIGLIHSKITLRTGIFNRKVLIQSSFRRSYLEAIFAGMEVLPNKKKKFSRGASYYFYDFNTKLQWDISTKHKLHADVYSGIDLYKQERPFYNLKSKIGWGNLAYSLRWNFIPNKAFSSNLVFGTSTYNFQMTGEFDPYKISINSGVSDLFSKAEINYFQGFNHLKAGFEYTRHFLKPNSVEASASEDGYASSPEFSAHEGAIFINNEMDVSEKMSVIAGIRTGAYALTGPFREIVSDSISWNADTVYFPASKILSRYYAVDPRFMLRYSLSNQTSLKFSYSHNTQFLHLISVGSVSFPTDIWFPSTKNIKPERVHQFSGGWFKILHGGNAEVSAEGFYKSFLNQLEFKNSLILQFDQSEFEKSIESGRGIAFGLELSYRKNVGRFTGSGGYTLSRTLRIFPNLNNGKAYPAKYDRTHDLSLYTNYKLSEKWSLSGLFVFSTGNAVNLPAGRYLVQGMVINDYNHINSFRMPPYHRLDLSATYSQKKTNKWESSWNFSIYNVYNRANPYYLFFIPKGDLDKYELTVEVRKMSIFPIMPSVSWNFKW